MGLIDNLKKAKDNIVEAGSSFFGSIGNNVASFFEGFKHAKTESEFNILFKKLKTLAYKILNSMTKSLKNKNAEYAKEKKEAKSDGGPHRSQGQKHGQPAAAKGKEALTPGQAQKHMQTDISNSFGAKQAPKAIIGKSAGIKTPNIGR